MKLRDILKKIDGKLLCGNSQYECSDFSKDTRDIKEGDVYLGIKGENFDGNKFWEDALQKGASTVIISEETNIKEEEVSKYSQKNIIKVKDTLEALNKIAMYKRSLYNIPVVAVTGSVGKTSTKDIIANVLSKKFKVLKTLGNNNNTIGLPLTILRLKDEEVMVLEMGMSELGEIAQLSKIAKPTISVIVNVGTAHIGNLGSRENILKAKLEILEGMEEKKIVINLDNDLLNKWYTKNKTNSKYEIFTYSVEEQSDKLATNIMLNEEYSEYTSKIHSVEETIKIPVAGKHFIQNGLASTIIGEELGVKREKIVEGIQDFSLTQKRMEIYNVGGVKIINDAYNASLESMKASLEILKNYENARKIAVLGDMFELGEFAKQIHEDVGKHVAKNNIDILVSVGENSKHMAKEAINQGGLEVVYIERKEEVKSKLEKLVSSGDIILFKASNGMKFYELAEDLRQILEKRNEND